jgi:hypothetical protein
MGSKSRSSKSKPDSLIEQLGLNYLGQPKKKKEKLETTLLTQKWIKIWPRFVHTRRAHDSDTYLFTTGSFVHASFRRGYFLFFSFFKNVLR